MEFDKNIFLTYMKNSIDKNVDVSYLYRLHRTYSVIDSDIIKNEYKLKKYEDLVYTVDGEIIDDKKRIYLALDTILSNINKNEATQDFINDYLDLNKKISELDLDKKENIMYIKKQISILQSKLNMKNTFFLAAHEAFLDLYRNIYIKTINDENRNEFRR